ncbi:UNVERIFIED_CONTAM: TBC1 domain family member 15 [Sesamum angustifolium]|uniref:TBC1 domain family member 15 n=1 Tax=Sesamum angustifolium TaxID=2727405 RepID=A0AAW2M5C3_9LAMI
MRALRRSQTSLGSNNTTPSPSSPSSSSSSSSWIPLRSVLLIVASSSSSSSSPVSSDRGSLKSPWSRRRRKHALLANSGRVCLTWMGVEPSIRAEVWPFPLGFYDVKSSNKERETIRAQKRREYVELRRLCRQIIKRGERSFKLKEMSGNNSNEDSGYVASLSGEVVSKDGHSAYLNTSRDLAELEEDDGVITNDNASEDETNSSVSESSDDPEDTKPLLGSMDTEDNHPYEPVASAPDKLETQPASNKTENFATWRRIIRLDAIRANAEWIIYSPSQAEVSEEKARKRAESVELKDYDNLEPCRIYHAARLVAILEAYAVYDPEIGYCQGMSDLLSPIISVIEEDHVAFWCFVGFMRKARHNFRLDENGGSAVQEELTFEQTLCLWEVMWADQAAIRAGIVKSAWRRMRLRAPPTDDLLLYAIAACVLQRRKLIIENYNSMDEIMKECNSMAGNLDVWKLLDDAHDLVVTLHDKI